MSTLQFIDIKLSNTFTVKKGDTVTLYAREYWHLNGEDKTTLCFVNTTDSSIKVASLMLWTSSDLTDEEKYATAILRGYSLCKKFEDPDVYICI